MGNDRWVQLFAKTVTKRFITLRMRRSRRYTEHAADNASVILKKSKKRKKGPKRFRFGLLYVYWMAFCSLMTLIISSVASSGPCTGRPASKFLKM